MVFLWIAFNIFLVIMLFFDLFFFHRKNHVVQYKESLYASFFWIVLACLFGLGIYFFHSKEASLNYFAGYLIEKALSVDNLFVFSVIFTFFSVPEMYLHKILFWGVVGALIMRAIFIFGGILLINQFHWIIYLFGGFLIYSGFKLGFAKNKMIDPSNNIVLRLARKFIPITAQYENGYFFIQQNGKTWATPLFVVLLAVETTDIMFAIDSVPAILAITSDPFIVYTSNAFAILGLRSLFFALSHMMKAFAYLNYGLALLLIFIGVKMLLSGYVEISTLITLPIIIIILGTSILLSILKETKKL